MVYEVATMPIKYNMQETATPTIAIRLGTSAITLFPLSDGASPIEIEMKSGMSVSANLREVLSLHSKAVSPHRSAIVLADTPTMLVPEEEYTSGSVDMLYDHAFSGHEQDIKESASLPSLRAVALFSIPRDVKTVVADHFTSVRYLPVCQPVWHHYSRQSYPMVRQRMFCYFHDGKVDLFATSGQRVKFCNAFSATHPHDAVYYMLNAFSQSGMKPERDELILLGTTPQLSWISDNLGKYVKNVSASDDNSNQPYPLDLLLLKTESK